MKVTKTTKPMTIDEIRTEADKAGFTSITFTKDGKKYLKLAYCKKCQKDSMLVFTAKEKGTKYHTTRACPCGYREMFGYGKNPTNNPPKEDTRTKSEKCGWEGDQCWHWLQGGDSECVRTKCVKYNKKPIKITNKCVGKGCNNDLPNGRKSFCYTCRPAAKSKKEAASSNFPM